jgi:hypothetical protein
MVRKTPYVSVHLTVPARTALQRLMLTRSLDLDERITISAVLLAAIEVANAHADEHRQALQTMIGESPS